MAGSASDRKTRRLNACWGEAAKAAGIILVSVVTKQPLIRNHLGLRRSSGRRRHLRVRSNMCLQMAATLVGVHVSFTGA